MEILNIGPLELIIILLLMFVLLGPKEMMRTAYRVGSWIRNFVRSPMWKEIMGYSQEIRELPQKIMEESGLQETVAEIKQSTQEAADELNNQLKEVKEAARIPEAEHLTLGTTDLSDTPSIKPDTLAAQPVPYQGEPAPSSAEVAASTEAVASENAAAAIESAVSSESAPSTEGASSTEGAPSTEGAQSTEGAPSNDGEGAAPIVPGPVVGIPATPTYLQPVEAVDAPAEEPPAAVLLVAEELPAPRKRRTKTAPVEGETPAPARTRRKKQDGVTEPPQVVEPTQPAALETESPSEPPAMLPVAEPAPAPRKGRPRKTVPVLDSAAPNGGDDVHPENGKSVEGISAEPARKPRARRAAKPAETPTNGNGVQHDPEQVTPSDAA